MYIVQTNGYYNTTVARRLKMYFMIKQTIDRFDKVVNISQNETIFFFQKRGYLSKTTKLVY